MQGPTMPRKPLGRTLSTEDFGKRVVLPMVTLVLVSIGLVVGFVVATAYQQNKLEVLSSTKLAQTALEVNRRHMARNLRDYAVWEDVYRNLHQRVDVSWAATDGNVGTNIHEGLGYQVALVVNPSGGATYSVVEGVPRRGAPEGLISSELVELVLASKAQEPPATGFLRLQGEIYLVAAASIIPPYIDREKTDPDSLSTLVFAKRLDQEWLSRIGEEYLLSEPRIVSLSDAQGIDASVVLSTPAGSRLAYVAWTPDTPGYELLERLFPPLTGAVVMMCVFASLALGNARRSTHALSESARTVQSYAKTLEVSEARFRDVAEASSDWIWECDEDLRFIYLSTRFSEVTGIAAATILGRSAEGFFTSKTDPDERSDLLAALQVRRTFRDIRCLYRDSEQEMRVCRLAGRPIKDEEGRFEGFRGTATDITEEVEAQARANYLALHDGLTGLPNRLLFRQRLEDQLEIQGAQTSRLAILCIDLDHFKEVNDMLGHAIGDALLIDVGARLRRCLSPGDTIARLGGDEFSILLVDAGTGDDVASLSLRIVSLIQEPFEIEGHEIHIGASIGVAFLDEEGSLDAGDLLKSADLALYRAKNTGRGTVRFFEKAMDIELQERKTLETELRYALGRNEFELYFQPILNLTRQTVSGAEALLRWHHPEFGTVSPEIFIPIAEKCGLIGEISEWVLNTACRQALEWNELSIAVNISPVHFRRPDLVQSIRRILRETRLPANRLELEVTESILIKDTEAALEVLNELREMGIQIAMDDFGTGYSSLAYLNSFPFDKIKIDRSFVSGSGQRDKSEAIVRSIVSLGRKLKMVVTAEGVETSDQLDFLIEEGCDQAQGYHFSRPVPAKDFNAFLVEWSKKEPARGHPNVA